MQTSPNYIPASQDTGVIIMDIYINWFKFNDKQLHIGWYIDGEIGNFRYFNWRLSAEEAMKNYLNQRPFC
ncbi:hypothetical protein RhiirA4_408960 [Rhizophagus irregularis]|uniref:Uncharacterized protein n=1 Tax=Rhizophagus irregularis TaxID=588596 RepID=A0A2I1H367_9GLOM|nr:hypothetical protein RhiirA4_408960 [Rhizophagus irregularis]